MENNLLRVVKYRILDELTKAISNHAVYRDKVKAFHKFPYSERPQMGVVLRNASSSRIKLSADDSAGTLKSHVALARAENIPGNFLQWVWEDSLYITGMQQKEDLSSQIVGTPSYGQNRVFYTSKKPIVSGKGNTQDATNFRQVYITLNGQQVFAEYVNGKKGIIILPQAPVPGDVLLITYHYMNLTPPGRYYVDMLAGNQYTISPFYLVKGEEVISRTTSMETTATLDNGSLYGNFDMLYTKKNKFSNNIYLIKDVDYTITNNGVITFLNALVPDTTLYADYRWVGTVLGPFPLPSEYHYDHTSLPGVIMSFGNQYVPGERQVIIVYPKREPAAEVYSGHYQMNFDIDVFSRDPMQLAELTDQLIEEIWNNRRQELIGQGLTITDMDPTGESEEVYDNNTGDLYYKNSISLQIMTEWKKYVPFLTEIMDFDTKLYEYLKLSEYIVTNQNQILQLRLLPNTVPFEVVYPKIGYARMI